MSVVIYFSNLTYICFLSFFHYARCITPKRVTSLRGPSLRHCTRGQHRSFQRNVATVASCWQHFVRFDWPKIWTGPQTRRGVAPPNKSFALQTAHNSAKYAKFFSWRQFQNVDSMTVFFFFFETNRKLGGKLANLAVWPFSFEVSNNLLIKLSNSCSTKKRKFVAPPAIILPPRTTL